MIQTYPLRLKRAQDALLAADYVLIGGGAGLSAAAGLTYDGTRFRDNFAPFIDKYKMTDMYTSGFYPFPTEETKWAYWAKHIAVNRYEPPALPLYLDLLRLVADKSYFVITTNVDHQFFKAGFGREHIFAVQGDYGRNQCRQGCHHTLYDNQDLVYEMIAQTDNCQIPTSLVPYCPRCSSPMTPNLRTDYNFIEDDTWDLAQNRYSRFISESRNAAIVFLELGVGFNTPSIIRYPFERMTSVNPEAILIRGNANRPDGRTENIAKTIAFPEDLRQVITDLLLDTTTLPSHSVSL